MRFTTSKRKLEFKIDGEIIRDRWRNYQRRPSSFMFRFEVQKLCSRILKKDEIELLLVNLAESEKRRRPRRLKIVDFFGFPKRKEN